ncbi:hypothetical protein LXL04_020416 [Taraxacum kok-saghyz]
MQSQVISSVEADGRRFSLLKTFVILSFDHYHWSGGVTCWQRQVRDGRSAAELSRLLELLSSFSCSDHRDKCVWELSEDGIFSVAETRRWIDNDILLEGSRTTRWCRLVPRKEYPGHVGHLFGSSDVAVRIWDVVARWLQMLSFAYLTPREVFARVDGSRINAKQKEVLEVVVYTVFWVIWRYRNDVVHDEGKIRKETIFYAIREFSFLWFCNRESKVSFFYSSWMQYPLNALYLELCLTQSLDKMVSTTQALDKVAREPKNYQTVNIFEIPKSKWGKLDGAVVEEIPKSKGEGKPVDRAPMEEGPATGTSERRGSDWCSVGGGA